MILFNVISIFPELIESALTSGVVGQARKVNLLEVEIYNPRLHTNDFHKTVDDRPYGGGDGMVMLAEPLFQTLKSLSDVNRLGKVVYLSPKGQLWSQNKAQKWSKDQQTLTLICGRYGGIDQRIINEWVDEEISIGDYVLSGGELAANVIIDSMARYIPGVLGNAESNLKDSLSDGLLEAPLFTRPQNIEGLIVPQVLLSGDHNKIEAFRKAISHLLTFTKRPDLWANYLKENSTFYLNKSLLSGLKQISELKPVELEICGVTHDQYEQFLKVNEINLKNVK